MYAVDTGWYWFIDQHTNELRPCYWDKENKLLKPIIGGTVSFKQELFTLASKVPLPIPSQYR